MQQMSLFRLFLNRAFILQLVALLTRLCCAVLCCAVVYCALPQWSPTLPGVFTTSNTDSKVAVCNVLDCTGSGTQETINADFSVTHVPGVCVCVCICKGPHQREAFRGCLQHAHRGCRQLACLYHPRPLCCASCCGCALTAGSGTDMLAA